MSPNIRFGTDGWRGIIAAEFTVDRLRQAAAAAAEVLADTYGPRDGVIWVGYDRRFLGARFAQVVAEAIRDVGLTARPADRPAPTPAFSYLARETGAPGALVVTASHNPPEYSGLKVKGAFGGSVPSDITQAIEARIIQGPLSPRPAGRILEPVNPWPAYVAALQAQVDIPALRAALASGTWQITAEVMHGVAATGLDQILGEGLVEEVNGRPDPLFGGFPPEPLPQYLTATAQGLRQAKGDPEHRLALVFDGDADRIAALDGEGNFLSPQVLIPVLIDHLAGRRRLTGEVVKTISGSELIRRVAEVHQCPLHETPIGFKYIAERMLTETVLLGGEESGGIGYGHFLPERDALLSALYLLEAVIQSGQSLPSLYRDLQVRTGLTTVYRRRDVHLTQPGAQETLLNRLATAPPNPVAGRPVLHLQDGDGYKFMLDRQAWLLIRFSGTEPLLRLYAEAGTPTEVDELLTWAETWAAAA